MVLISLSAWQALDFAPPAAFLAASMLYRCTLMESRMLQGELYYYLKSHYRVVAYSHSYPHNSIHSLIMYAYVLHGDTQKKCKARHLYDGSDGVSYGHPSGLTSVHITKLFIDPLDPVNLEPGHRTKRACFDKITHSQFPAFEEQAKREITAQRASKHYLTCVSTWTNL